METTSADLPDPSQPTDGLAVHRAAWTNAVRTCAALSALTVQTPDADSLLFLEARSAHWGAVVMLTQLIHSGDLTAVEVTRVAMLPPSAEALHDVYERVGAITRALQDYPMPELVVANKEAVWDLFFKLVLAVQNNEIAQLLKLSAELEVLVDSEELATWWLLRAQCYANLNLPPGTRV